MTTIFRSGHAPTSVHCAAVLRELEALGTAQNRKIYARHGVKSPMFGVSYTHLTRIQKRIKTDHELARELWASGNHDARVLATMIADPRAATVPLLNAWKKDLDNPVLSDAFSGFVVKTSHAHGRMEQWMRSKHEWVGRVGWLLLARLARTETSPPDAQLTRYVRTIERDIHGSRNRVRDAMNSALIAIGARDAALEKRAIAAARKIGKVVVDHGETGCKPPDAEAYILKTRQRARAASAG